MSVFLHRDRPGRVSLALDLMEELRGLFADRFIITLINRKEIGAKGFIKRGNSTVIMNDTTRKIVLTAWQERKREIINNNSIYKAYLFPLLTLNYTV